MEITSLKKRHFFLEIAKSGNKAVTKGLILQTKQNLEQNTDFIQVGYTTTKKLGNAVVRNRIKRKLRAVAKFVIQNKAKASFDYVIIGRKATFDRSFNELVKDLKYALHSTKTHK